VSNPWVWIVSICAFVLIGSAALFVWNGKSSAVSSATTVISDPKFWQDRSDLPALKVDDEHSQMNGEDAPFYALKAPVGFTLDFSAAKLTHNDKLTIQIIATPLIYIHAFDPTKLRYSFCPEEPLKAGQQLVVAVGSQSITGKKVDFTPLWAGIVAVK
jgi:hypothetical protein